jgi:F-type H+-transporting ATPase subunit epsilon
MADKIQLEIITPERCLLSESVDYVAVPGLNGELGILPGHTPLISQLKTGILSYTQNSASSTLLVSGGFVEVNGDRVSVLADIAERADEIDTVKARLDREQAEKLLGSASSSEEDLTQAQLQLERASYRLQLASETVSTHR